VHTYLRQDTTGSQSQNQKQEGIQYVQKIIRMRERRRKKRNHYLLNDSCLIFQNIFTQLILLLTTVYVSDKIYFNTSLSQYNRYEK